MAGCSPSPWVRSQTDFFGDTTTRDTRTASAGYQALNRKRGVTVIVITHEPDIAEFAERVVAFKDGLIVEDRKVPADKRRGRSVAGV